MGNAYWEILLRSADDHFRAARFPQAAAEYQRAIAAGAKSPEVYDNLGMVLSKLGQFEPAAASFRAALQLRPNDLHAGINLGNALSALGRLEEAAGVYRNVMTQHPSSANAHYNLGRVLYQLGRLDESILALRDAIANNGSHAEAHASLGNALKDCGLLDEALAQFRRAIEIKPQLVGAHSNLLYSLHFHPDVDPQTILRECRQFNDRHASNAGRALPANASIRGQCPPYRSASSLRTGSAESRNSVRGADPTKRFRVGYVSPDFRAHCNAHFTLPLLESHDHARFEIYCYSDVTDPDEVTENLRGHADVWRNIVGLSDENAANLIVSDQIDILIDLTLHMANGRPLLFARKPAPVQATWLGYPGTTGLSAMDFRITDPYLDPPGMNDADYVEKSIRLPETYWCYDPLNTDLTVGPLPALSQRHVTFGCLNNFCKVNDRVLEMFAGALRAVEKSQLILLAPTGSTRQRVLDAFESLNVARERIEFVDRQPWRSYMQVYHRIDLALDTFPWNGHTTSLDGLWMGVPMVTLCGRMPVSRGGFGILSNLGLTEFVANSSEQYIQTAAQWSDDFPRLADVRAGLRQRMQQSPLMDKTRFARAMETAYLEMSRISGLI